MHDITLNTFRKEVLSVANYELKKYPKEIRNYIIYNGDSLPDFYRPAREGTGLGAEFYIKLYVYLVDNKLSEYTGNLPFYVSTKGIQGIFNKTLKYKKDGSVKAEGFGNDYCLKTIQRAIRRLLRLKLISYKKAPKKADREDPDEFIPHREILVNMDVAKELFNIYEPEVDQFIKDYAMKLAIDETEQDKTISEELQGEKIVSLYKYFRKQLKKIAKKRPYNYTEKIEEKYQEYKEAGIAKEYKYKDAKEMLTYYQYHVSKRYSKKNIFKKFIPNHLKDKQKEADRLAREKASPYGNLTEEDILRIRQLEVPDANVYVDKLIGYSIPDIKLQKEAQKVFIIVDKHKHTVIGYNIDEAKLYMNPETQLIDYNLDKALDIEKIEETSCNKYETTGWDHL